MLGFRIEGLEDDFEKIMTKAQKSVSEAMPYLGIYLKDQLAEHIQSDVYNAYSPKVYKRRSDQPSIVGKALNDLDDPAIFNVVTNNTSIEIEYTPNGEHPQLKPKQTLNGDLLIQRIETGKGYSWKMHPGPRPFFQNFVNEELGGKVAEALWAVANTLNPDIQFKADAKDIVEPEAGDWMG